MTTKQPEALRLANVCSNLTRYSMDAHLIAAELRTQQARITELEQEVAHTDSLLGKANALASIRAHRIAELEAQLEAIGAGGVSALMGAAKAGSEPVASYAIRLLVAAALITQAKADEALRLAAEITAAPGP